MQWLYSHRNAAQSTTDVRAALSIDPPTTAPVSRRASRSARAQPGGTTTWSSITATASPEADSNAICRICGMVVLSGTARTRAVGKRRATSDRTESPIRSTTSISRDTSVDCACSAARQPIRSPSPFTDGTTTESSAAIATAERTRGASDIADGLADRPRRDEGERGGQRAEERAPPCGRGGACDACENHDGKERSHRREQPAPRAALLDESRPCVIASVLVAIAHELPEVIRLVLIDRRAFHEMQRAAARAEALVGHVLPLTGARPRDDVSEDGPPVGDVGARQLHRLAGIGSRRGEESVLREIGSPVHGALSLRVVHTAPGDLGDVVDPE